MCRCSVWWPHAFKSELMKSPNVAAKVRRAFIRNVFAFCVVFFARGMKEWTEQRWMKSSSLIHIQAAYKYGIQSSAYKFPLFDLALVQCSFFSLLCSINMIFFRFRFFFFCWTQSSLPHRPTGMNFFLLFYNVVLHRLLSLKLPVLCVL